MSEKSPQELADIQKSSEKSSEGLEIVKNPALNSLVDKANELAEAIQRDQDITAGQILDLEKDLSELKFDVCGEQMTLAEIKEIPDFQHNYKFWQEIKNGIEENHYELTYLIPSIAGILSKSTYANIWNEETEPTLHLEGLRTLSKKTAEKLSTYNGYLELDGLENIPDDVFEQLSKLPGEWLSLNGITSLTNNAARYLSERPGRLSLNSIESLSDEAAKYLSHHRQLIWMKGLKNISDIGLTYLIDANIHMPILEERRKKIKAQQNA